MGHANAAARPPTLGDANRIRRRRQSSSPAASLLVIVYIIVLCIATVASSVDARDVVRVCGKGSGGSVGMVPPSLFLHLPSAASPPSSWLSSSPPFPSLPLPLSSRRRTPLPATVPIDAARRRSFAPPSFLAAASSSSSSLRERILSGARGILQEGGDGSRKEHAGNDGRSSDGVGSGERKKQSSNSSGELEQGGGCRYYIREGRRSEVEAIADLLMEAFHGDPSDPRRVKPAFDSYLRRYKLNHLAMCFDAIEERHRTLLVACAVTREVKVADSQTRSLITVEKKDGVSGARDGGASLTQQDKEKETIVGFCSVDGRPNDPSSRLEHSSASSLVNSPPRPYLSDLGVSHFHRRKGVGIALVKACEDWVVAVASNATANDSTNAKGNFATELYLRVDGDNTAARGLYVDRLGYDVVSLPFGGHAPGSASAKYDKTVLLRKSVCCENDTVDNDGEDGKGTAGQQRRTWLRWPLSRGTNAKTLGVPPPL